MFKKEQTARLQRKTQEFETERSNRDKRIKARMAAMSKQKILRVPEDPALIQLVKYVILEFKNGTKIEEMYQGLINSNGHGPI